MILPIFILVCKFSTLVAYYNQIYTLTNESDTIFGDACDPQKDNYDDTNKLQTLYFNNKEVDPVIKFEEILYNTLFGPQSGENEHSTNMPVLLNHDVVEQQKLNAKLGYNDELAHCPSGTILRAELFAGKPGVHLPPFEFMHVGHCYLNQTADAMQTAVDAFAIFLRGTVRDVLRLPPDYVLKSARTIAMMKVPKEKLNATWEVVKRGRLPEEVQHWELELFRPLFHYLNGREIARLDLTNPAILTYIGTHADLNRHQVGVVASSYIRLNSNWSHPQYLNMMNNLLCGVPMALMRRIDPQTYLNLPHQVFYHVRACDALQRRFYLALMTRTDALGKSYSWSARDVARLGLLLAEVEGSDLAAVAPEAMSGLTAQVMLEMSAVTLQHITDEQVKYLSLMSLGILTRKLTRYRAQQRSLNRAKKLSISIIVALVIQCLAHEIN